ncbi:MAG: 3-keto-5-aminohexanoate cleavage protein [Brevirhabdus sp.]
MLTMIAPNGATRTKADHPHLPITIPEIVATACDCHAKGADALHLHVRDALGRHSLDTGLYREALGELARTVPAMAVQVTTESAGLYGPSEQASMLLDLKPGWASLALREAAQDMDIAQRLYADCAANGIRLQHILYDEGDIALLTRFSELGWIGADPEVLLVLGRYGTGGSNPKDIAPFRASLPDDTRWMLCAFGPIEHKCLVAAAALGGDIRVGFENAVVDRTGSLWPDMAASVTALLSRRELAA